jgi:hypothetical protein
MTTINAARADLAGPLRPYLSTSQRRAMEGILRGEEGAYMAEIVDRLVTTLATLPKTYEPDGQGLEAIVHLHYFGGGADAWLTELDIDGGLLQCFGAVGLYGPGSAELGYINVTELVDAGLELDLHWTPRTLGEVMGDRPPRHPYGHDPDPGF